MRSCLKWFGGKTYLAPQFAALADSVPHTVYCEPYFGGGAVLFAKDQEGHSEIVNDLDGDLTNFWKVLQHDHGVSELRRRLCCTPFSEAEWKEASEVLADPVCSDPIDRAAAFFVQVRQSRAGLRQVFSPPCKSALRRGMNRDVSAWLSAVDGLPLIAERLARVEIFCRPALDVIRQCDAPETLFYLDPPYVHATRTGSEEYAVEMTDGDHGELLDALCKVRGKVILSGYAHEMYDRPLDEWHWRRREIDVALRTGPTASRKTEVVWWNFDAPYPAQPAKPAKPKNLAQAA